MTDALHPRSSGYDVVVVCDQAHVAGGAGKVALESAVGLAHAGHRVTLFSAVGPIWPALRTAGVDVVCLGQHDHWSDPNPLRSALQGLWNYNAATALQALLHRRDPQKTIVHVHAWNKALSPSIGSAIVRSGFPVVYTMHDYFLACPNGSFFDYQESRNCSREPLSLACLTHNCDSRSYPYKAWRAARHTLLRKTRNIPSTGRHFIYLSALQLDTMRRFLPVDAKLHRVDNPVSVERAPPVNIAVNDTFLFAGRLSREKGAELFACAARDINEPVRFIGDGPERSRVASILPRAEMSGWLAPADVVAAMESARALVFPSIWYEGQPLITLEASARGLPAIVSDNTAAREQIVHDKTGLLFKSGDIESLKAALSRLDPTTAARLGRAAYDDYWRNPFTPERHVAALENVYDEVMADARTWCGQPVAVPAGLRS